MINRAGNTFPRIMFKFWLIQANDFILSILIKDILKNVCNQTVDDCH